MPLPLPVLDRRTWDELVSEARTLLPRFAPAWTDHNVHDPGITLIELLAWVSELLMFRADRIPPAELRAFLRWLGIEPLPPQAAATVLALDLPPGSTAQPLAGGLVVADGPGTVVFEADDAILVSPAWLEVSPAEGTTRGRIWSFAGGALADLSDQNCQVGAGFLPFGPAPQPGDALLLGFDVKPAELGDILSFYVWTTSWETDGDARARLIAEDEDLPPCPPPLPSWPTCAECLAGAPTPPDPTPHQPTWFLHYSARVVWEGWDGATWAPLEVMADETRALTLSGPVQLKAGALLTGAAESPDPARFWLRCRLVDGSYECPPRLAGVALNTVIARNAVKVTGPEVMGISLGYADEVYRVAGTIAAQGPGAVPQPLLPGTLRLRVVAGGPPDDSWVEVPNWDRTGPFDRHYTTEPKDNSIHVGNGWVGRVLPPNAAVEALEYRVGGGIPGNVPARRLTEVLAGGVGGLVVRQPFPATGGAAAETLDRAHGRALALLAHPARAITVGDFEALALEVPGVPVARAAAIPRFHPDLGCWTAPGVVTVVVVPACGRPPKPSPDFIAAVGRYMERRRPITTELHVVGPGFVRITVEATLHASPGTSGLPSAAQKALDAFFDPLTGGPVGTGWPFGRDVLASDLLAVLAGLPQVQYVDELAIEVDGEEGRCENVALCPTDLVDSQTHRITVVEG